MSTTPEPIHLVFANRHSLFKDWCATHSLTPNRNAFHVTRFEQLRGISQKNTQWHIIGDFDNDPLLSAAYSVGCPPHLPKESPY